MNNRVFYLRRKKMTLEEMILIREKYGDRT